MRVAGFLLAAGIAAATDFTGTWAGQIPNRNNEPQDVVFRFIQTGSELTGKLYGDTEDLILSDGVVDGKTLRFVINTEGYGGKFQWIFQGELEGGQLVLKRSREDAVPRSGSGPKRPPQKIVLRRMT